MGRNCDGRLYTGYMPPVYLWAMAKKDDPAYLMHFPGKLKADLMEEAEATNRKLIGYLLHLIETHPERPSIRKRLKAAKARK